MRFGDPNHRPLDDVDVFHEIGNARLILQWDLGKGVAARVEGKSEQRHEDADRAKGKTDNDAGSEEGRFRGELFFHDQFFRRLILVVYGVERCDVSTSVLRVFDA